MNRQSEIEELHQLNNHLLHKLITLEVIVDSLYTELLENNTFDEESFNSKVSTRVKKINDELENSQKIVDTLNTYSMFMSNSHGEA
jgi:hypothetical protein